MADRKGLERIGMVFALVTGVVMMTGAIVVKDHREPGAGLDNRALVAVSRGLDR